MGLSSHGATQTVVATVSSAVEGQLKSVRQIQGNGFSYMGQCGVSGGESSTVQDQLRDVTSKPPLQRLLPFWPMALSSHGTIHGMVATAVPLRPS